MLLCWCTAIKLLTPAEVIQHEYIMVSNKEEDLPLPTWNDIIGIDLMLFEPIPPKTKNKPKTKHKRK